MAMLGATAALAGLLIVAASVNIAKIIAAETLTARLAAAIATLVLAILTSGIALIPHIALDLFGALVLLVAAGAPVFRCTPRFRSGVIAGTAALCSGRLWASPLGRTSRRRSCCWRRPSDSGSSRRRRAAGDRGRDRDLVDRSRRGAALTQAVRPAIPSAMSTSRTAAGRRSHPAGTRPHVRGPVLLEPQPAAGDARAIDDAQRVRGAVAPGVTRRRGGITRSGSRADRR
jgi:hypothetical protein